MNAHERSDGSRVFLRPPDVGDQDELCRLRRDSWGFLAPWEPTPALGESPYGPAWFAGYMRGARKPNVERRLVCARSDGRILGNINVSEIVRGSFQSGYLGYWVAEREARRGYMREGLGAMLTVVFEDLGLHRVEANIRPENAASIALVRGAGFSLEGLSPRYLRIDGEWRDHERWALLVEDWSAART